jgi:hypothetical protein
VKKAEPKKVVNPLFEKRPRNFGIGKMEHSISERILNIYWNLMPLKYSVLLIIILSCEEYLKVLFHIIRSGYPAISRFKPICKMAKVYQNSASEGCTAETSESSTTN